MKLGGLWALAVVVSVVVVVESRLSPSLDPFVISGLSLSEVAEVNTTYAIGAGTYFRTELVAVEYYDYVNDVPDLSRFQETKEPLLLQAAQFGLKPVMLFSYYPNLGFGNGQGLPVGNYSKWYQIGKQFAEKYGEGGTWAQANGLGNYGVSVWTAFNEADICGEAYGLQAWDPQEYYDALLGLADGIHSVNPSYTFLPGGFAAPNRDLNFDLQGLGPVLAPLWNNGTLDGIDLHIYSSTSGGLTWDRGAQSAFNQVKAASGITADVDFYMTEYNYYFDYPSEDEDLGAKQLLTAIWDGWGVVKNDGKTPATVMSLVFDIFHPAFEGGVTFSGYGLANTLSPWSGTQRATTLLMTIGLAKGLRFVFADPMVTGVYILEGIADGLQKKLVVWQNRPTWTNITGTNYTFEAGALNGYTTVDVYGWDGLRASYTTPLTVVPNLPPGETYMILASGPVPASSGATAFSWLSYVVAHWLGD